MQKITTFLWFDTQAEEAMNHYLSIFKNSKAGTISRYTEAGPGPAGSAMLVNFELEGQQFMALNAGPQFHFNPAISLFVKCAGQQEVDELWDKLCEGGKPGQCGWLEDKYGLSWQLVPAGFMEIMGNPDPEKSKKAFQAMMQMQKLDLAKLKEAAES